MPLATDVNLTIRDDKDEYSTMTLHVAQGYALADISPNVTLLAQTVDALIRGKIERITVSLPINIGAIAGLKPSPFPNADVEEGARFQFRTTESYPTGFRIPTFDEQFLVPRSTLVDITAPEVDTLIGIVETGSGLWVYSDNRSQDIQRFASAFEDFQGSRRSRR